MWPMALAALLIGWLGAGLADAASKSGGPVRPDAMVTVPYAPLVWAEVDGKGRECQRMLKAGRALAEARDALADLLERRRALERAQARPDHEVLLDMREAMLTYANNQVRPMPGTAPYWRDLAGQSLSRIRGCMEDFEAGREDVQMLFQQRGGTWLDPQLGMLTSKFLQSLHAKGCAGVSFKWNDTSFAGRFALASARGDRRYQMHHSGEGSTVSLPEFRQWKDFASGWWPDWWGGPRARLRRWTESFVIDAGERRGWMLKATLRAGEPSIGFTSHDRELFAWIEDGRVLRGYAIVPGRLPGRGPELRVRLERWSLAKGGLEVQLVLGSDTSRRRETWTLTAALPQPDCGGFTGRYKTVRERPNPESSAERVRDEQTGVAEGTLFRAYRGAYRTDGLDGRRTGEALAGVAAVPRPAKVRLPAVPIEAGLSPAAIFANVVELWRQVAALDWALREYPLPLAEALRAVRDGRDDRSRYYPGYIQWYLKATRKAGSERQHVPAVVRPHMHEAIASMMGAKAEGAAAYAERLVEVARAALADRKAKAAPTIGVGSPVDPDFGPYAGLRLAGCGGGVNALPGATADDPPGWAALDDWTCHGFIMRCSSFETGPYLPELPIVPGLRPGGAALEIAKPVRLAHPDRGEHLWAWRARPTGVGGLVTIPRECLLLTKAETLRRRWSATAGAGVAEETLDFYYNTFVSWYGTTTLKSAKRQRVWMAARIDWDGRVWVNDRLVWRPSREHTSQQIAVFPVDLEAGLNRITVCSSMRPVGDGNTGNFGAYVYKHGVKAFGPFTVWVAGGVEPRSAEAVAAARKRQQACDRRSAAARAARGLRGRRGDGTGLYPDAKPPVAWDIERGINIRWKRPIPTDDAEPVIVGERLFVTTYTGELVCLNARTGAELWRKKPRTAGAPAAGEYPPLAVAASFAVSARMWVKGKPRKIKPHAAYARSCLTPVADRDRVWMHDPRGSVACFDHAGRQRWAHAVAAQTPHYAEGGYVKARILPPTHPAAIGSRLIAAVGEGLTAFDLQTGKVVWQRPTLDYLGQFAVMEPLDGAAEGLVLLSSGEVLDAGTGKTVLARCAPLMPDAACEPVVNGQTAYFHACNSAVRFWRDPAGKLCSRVLWCANVDIKKRQHDMSHNNRDNRSEPRNFTRSAAYPPTPVLLGDLLFEHMGEQMTIEHGPQQSMRLHTFDASTGCAVSQRYALQLNATHPVTSTIVAGGLVFCGDEGGFVFGDYPNFPQTPAYAIVTAEEQPRRVTRDQPGLASLSPPTFAGECMYLAGEGQVVCVGRPAEPGDRYSDCELDALRETFFRLEVGDKPGPANEGKVLRFEPPADLKPGKAVPVVAVESGKTVDRWLFAGPFEVAQHTDVFDGKGGAAAARPEQGLSVAYTAKDGQQRAVAFAPLDSKHLFDRDWAHRYQDPRLEGAPDLASACGRKLMTTCYLYTVLDCRQDGYYHVDFSTRLMRQIHVYLAGRRLAPESRIELKRGRYPLMVWAAIGTAKGHERMGWRFRLLSLSRQEAEQGVEPIEPAPLEKLPEGLRAPVAPLLLETLPPRMIGAWPVETKGQGNPYEHMTAVPGALVSEGAQVAFGGKTTAFRVLPPGAIDAVGSRRANDSLHFNAVLPGNWHYGAGEVLGLSAPALFADRAPACGLFFAVLHNPRSVCVQAYCKPNVRCWLSGKACLANRSIRLKPGFYPFLIEYRPGKADEKPVLPVTFRQVPDPDIELARWRQRLRRNAEMLRAIAASGVKGGYVGEALNALGDGHPRTGN